jgi:hypothetical protein
LQQPTQRNKQTPLTRLGQLGEQLGLLGNLLGLLGNLLGLLGGLGNLLGQLGHLQELLWGLLGLLGDQHTLEGISSRLGVGGVVLVIWWERGVAVVAASGHRHGHRGRVPAADIWAGVACGDVVVVVRGWVTAAHIQTVVGGTIVLVTLV